MTSADYVALVRSIKSARNPVSLGDGGFIYPDDEGKGWFIQTPTERNINAPGFLFIPAGDVTIQWTFKEGFTIPAATLTFIPGDPRIDKTEYIDKPAPTVPTNTELLDKVRGLFSILSPIKFMDGGELYPSEDKWVMRSTHSGPMVNLIIPLEHFELTFNFAEDFNLVAGPNIFNIDPTVKPVGELKKFLENGGQLTDAPLRYVP